MIIENEIIEMAKKFAIKNKDFILNAEIIDENAEISFFKIFNKENKNCIIYTETFKNFIDEIYDFCFKGKENNIKSDFSGHLSEYNNKTLAELENLKFFNKEIFFNETIFPIFMFVWATVKEDRHRNREILTIYKTNIEKIIPSITCSSCNQKLIFDYNSKERKFTLSKLKEYNPCLKKSI